MPNRLAQSNSPYLLQHQDNPVDWYPWGEEALDKAKAEDKPIFLSIGYAACHWCHVMAHESFEDEETAALMNETFVNIKVDREERPDIDGIYMDAVVALSGSGGWPMSVFLTPNGEPFIGGTYFPPVARHGLPSFRELLGHVKRLWAEDREKILELGQELLHRLKASNISLEKSEGLSEKSLEEAAMGLAQSYDWQKGGWGRAPKFPQPMAIDFLLGRSAGGDKMALDMTSHALKAMAKGGMYDVVGGGFARYSVDDGWLVPHFEKMLYDNAQLARAYLHAYLITKVEKFRDVCERTLDFIAREMRHDDGAFYSSLDADSEGEEGKFYIWSLEEIKALIKDKEEREIFITAYGITANGNYEGHNILQRVSSDAELVKQFGMAVEDIGSKLDSMHTKLLEAREKRVRPGTDDKALTAWNAMMLTAFAEAGRYLNRPDYVAIARENAIFLLNELHNDERLLRSWRAGRAEYNAYLEDYAALILALLALYQSDPDVRWFSEAEKLAKEMIAHYRDAAGSFFDTRDDHEELITRPKAVQDNATPSGNSLASLALLQLATYTGNGEWHDLAMQNLGAMQSAARQYPTTFGNWLSAMSFALADGREIAIIGKAESEDRQALVDVLWSEWRPFDVAAISPHPPEKGAPSLLKDRPLVNGKSSAYVCQQFVCKKPVNNPKAFSELL